MIKAAEQEDGEQEEQQQQAPPPEVIAQQVEAEVMQRPEYAMKAAQARKAEADAMKSELELQIAVAAANAPQPAPMPIEEPMPQPDPMQAIEQEVMKKRALTQIDLEAETYRKRLDAQMSRAQKDGVDPDDIFPMDDGPSPIEQLREAVAMQGQMMQSGLSELAQAMAMMAQTMSAPKRIIRDDKNRVAGVETVI